MSTAAPTPPTIDINGHPFTVDKSAALDREGRTKYILRKINGRGLTYETMRNANKPEILFCINPNASKLPGIWLHESADGLRQVEW